MGWMNDTLSYVRLDPIHRQYHHNHLSFSMMYAFTENFVLPLSHDEVVHGKGSLIDKMPGYYEDKFAGLRVYLSYMMAHPGKKLLFMGGEFGQFAEWNFRHSLDWHLLEFEPHQKLQSYVRELNLFYLRNRPLWERDDSWEGFQWINPGDYQGNTLSFRRMDSEGDEVICLFSFSPVNRPGYRLGLPGPGTYQEVLSSSDSRFGGWGSPNSNPIPAQNIPCNDLPWSIQLDLLPFGAIFLKKA